MFVASWDDVRAARKRLCCAPPKDGSLLWFQKDLIRDFQVLPTASSSSLAQFIFGGYVLYFEGQKLKQRLRDLWLVEVASKDSNKPSDLRDLYLGEGDMWVAASFQQSSGLDVMREADSDGKREDAFLARLRPSRPGERLVHSNAVTILTQHVAYPENVFSLLFIPKGEKVSIGSGGNHFDDSFWKKRER